LCLIHPCGHNDPQGLHSQVYQIIDRGLLLGRKTAEHEFLRLYSRRRSSDTETQPSEVFEPQRIRYGTDAFVPSVASSNFDANLALREIQIVVNHDHCSRIGSDSFHDGAHGLTAQIHIGLRLREDQPRAFNSYFADHGLFAICRPEPIFLACKLIYHHKPEIMTVAGISPSGVSQSHNQDSLTR